MRLSEWIAAADFGYLLLAGWAMSIPRTRRLQMTVAVTLALGLVALLSSLPSGPAARVARDWLIGIAVLLGYWIPAFLYQGPNLRFERWLIRTDRQLLGRLRIHVFVERAPRAVLEYFELAYLSCYLVVPAGLAILYVAGRSDRADQFWATVFLASLPCYALLPWLPSRPPRIAEGESGIDRRPLAVRRLNCSTLKYGSVQANTFPSGHAAAALATALVVGTSMPVAGSVLAFLSLSIAAGSVLGRYHYAADAIAGLLVAVGAFLTVAMLKL